MFISKLIMVPSAKYHAPLIRPYMVHMDRYLENDLAIGTNGGQNLSASAIAGVAGQILTPTPEGEKPALIANGWSEPRMQFMMEIEHPSMDGIPRKQFITGYTDYVGYTRGSGHVDPNMRFYLNYSVDTFTSIHATHHGNVPMVRMRSANHIMYGGNEVPYGSFLNSNEGKFAIRPTDLATGISMAGEEYQDFDLSSKFGMSPSDMGQHLKTSRVNNGLPNRYLSDVFKGYKAAANTGEVTKDFGQMLSDTAGRLREDTLSRNLFISELLRKGTSLSEGEFFTFSDLCDLFPETSNNTVILEHEAHKQSMFGMAGNDFVNYTDDFNTPSYQVLTATMISNSLPGIMMDSMLTNISFTCTNKTLNGQPYIAILGFGSFASMGLEQFAEIFKSNFIAELWPALSKNNEVDLSINVQFDIVSHSTVVIEWQNEPPMTFAVPTFTDNLFAPVITTKKSHVETIANDFSAVLNSVQSIHGYTDYNAEDTGYGNFDNSFNTPAPQHANQSSPIIF